MKYAIIGLGNYGAVLAEELSALGNEVVGADNNAERIELIKDKITKAYILDATDALSLASLPLTGVDAVIVAVGENFGASVKIVALLKKMKIKHIYARSIDEVHEGILQAFNVEKILSPEADSARSFVRSLQMGYNSEVFKVDEEYCIIKFKIPLSFAGIEINELNLDTEYKLKIIAIKRENTTRNFLGMSVTESKAMNSYPQDLILQESDELVCYGKYQDFMQFWKAK